PVTNALQQLGLRPSADYAGSSKARSDLGFLAWRSCFPKALRRKAGSNHESTLIDTNFRKKEATRITRMSGEHTRRRVGLKDWPSLRVRCSGGSPKQSSFLQKETKGTKVQVEQNLCLLCPAQPTHRGGGKPSELSSVYNLCLCQWPDT